MTEHTDDLRTPYEKAAQAELLKKNAKIEELQRYNEALSAENDRLRDVILSLTEADRLRTERTEHAVPLHH